MRRDQDVRFVPLRPGTTLGRAALLLAGPFIWVGSLVAVDLVAREGDDIVLALLVAGASFALALPLIVAGLIGRNRREGRR